MSDFPRSPSTKRSTALRWLRGFALLLALAALAACGTAQKLGAALTGRIAIDEAQLQEALAREYPQTYPQLGGLLDLTVLNPQLTIPGEGARVHVDFDVAVSGLGLRGDRPAGHIAITSGLRFDAYAQALFLDDPRLESAEFDVLGGRMNSTGRDLINRWLREYARKEPVYRLDADERAGVAGRQVKATRVEGGKVIVLLD